MNRRAIIFGIKGYRLTNKEKYLFRKKKTMGNYIIFKKYKEHITIKKFN